MYSIKIRALSILALGTVAACDPAVADRAAGNNKGELDVVGELGGQGKADIGKKAKLIDDVGPEAEVVGTFDPRMRVYGYVVDARAGAKLHMAISATAGADSRDLDEGEALDTVLTLYGPYKGPSDPGEQIVYHDDDGSSLPAPPIDFEVPADGRYLLAMSSWEDTGTGKYTVDIECQGTDFQCARPDFANPCVPGQMFVQGAAIDADATWDRCEVVMLEPVTVAEDAILTIDPGVTVRGNYLGAGNFGDVELTVDGTLQAAGTEADPIRFTSLNADRGWRGIVFNGPSSSMAYTYVERAQIALQINTGASLSVRHAVIEGGIPAVTTASGTGVLALNDSVSTFQDVLVHNFQTGINANRAEDMLIEDSVIRDNNEGIRVTGDGSTSSSCGSTPPQVTVWRDPRIVNSDIIDNNGRGIRVLGRDVLVQVEQSNLVGNSSFAFELTGRRLHPESYLRNNNILDNGNGGAQVRTTHWTNGGTLDISSNYWEDISDPELSANWQRNCNGPVTFEGFSPTPIDSAGPRHTGSWFAVCGNALTPCEEGEDPKEPEVWDGLEDEGTVAKNEERRWETPELQPGTYLFSMSGNNDADLYVRSGSAPTESNFDCRPFTGSSTEACTVDLVEPSIIHVMVRGWASSSEFTLVGQEI